MTLAKPVFDGLAVLLAVALVGLWLRSTRVSDTFEAIGPRGVCWSVSTHPHGIDVGRSDAFRIPVSWKLTVPQPHPGLNGFTQEYGMPVPFMSGLAGPSPPSGLSERTAEVQWRPLGTWVAGFGWDRQTVPIAPPIVTVPTAYHYWTVYVPFWFVLLLTLAWPTARLGKAIRRKRRRDAGQCERCGYDLRGSPGQCPECGAVVPSGQPERP